MRFSSHDPQHPFSRLTVKQQEPSVITESIRHTGGGIGGEEEQYLVGVEGAAGHDVTEEVAANAAAAEEHHGEHQLHRRRHFRNLDSPEDICPGDEDDDGRTDAGRRRRHRRPWRGRPDQRRPGDEDGDGRRSGRAEARGAGEMIAPCPPPPPASMAPASTAIPPPPWARGRVAARRAAERRAEDRARGGVAARRQLRGRDGRRPAREAGYGPGAEEFSVGGRISAKLP
jgi:hypothetical protein